MAKTEGYLSQSKYGEHRNVTKSYITRLIKEGRLHLIKGKLNVKMSDAELDNKSNNDKAPNYWSEKALHEKPKTFQIATNRTSEELQWTVNLIKETAKAMETGIYPPNPSGWWCSPRWYGVYEQCMYG